MTQAGLTPVHLTQIIGLSPEALEAITTVAEKAPFLLAYPAADIEFMIDRLIRIRQGVGVKVNTAVHGADKAIASLEAMAAKLGDLADLVERETAKRGSAATDKSDDPLKDVPTTLERELWGRAKMLGNLPPIRSGYPWLTPPAACGAPGMTDGRCGEATCETCYPHVAPIAKEVLEERSEAPLKMTPPTRAFEGCCAETRPHVHGPGLGDVLGGILLTEGTVLEKTLEKSIEPEEPAAPLEAESVGSLIEVPADVAAAVEEPFAPIPEDEGAEPAPEAEPTRCVKCRRIIIMPKASEVRGGECDSCVERPPAPWESCSCPIGMKSRPAPLHYLECQVLEWWRTPSKFKATEPAPQDPESTAAEAPGEALVREIEAIEAAVETSDDSDEVIPFDQQPGLEPIVTFHDDVAPAADDDTLVCESCQAEVSELVGGECAACVELVTLYTIGGSKVSIKRSNILREVDVDGRRMAATKTMGGLYVEDPTETPKPAPIKEVAKSTAPLAASLAEIALAIAKADARRVSVPQGFHKKMCDKCEAHLILPEDRKSGRYRCWDHSKPEGQDHRTRIIKEHLALKVHPSRYAAIASLLGLK